VPFDKSFAAPWHVNTTSAVKGFLTLRTYTNTAVLESPVA